MLINYTLYLMAYKYVEVRKKPPCTRWFQIFL
jgi:hypothetical protein